MDGIQWGKRCQVCHSIGTFHLKRKCLGFTSFKEGPKKHLFLCPMWATEKQERTWVSVGKKVYSSISNSTHYLLTTQFISTQQNPKSMIHTVIIIPFIFSSLLMKVLDNFHSSQLHEMVMEELNLGSTLNCFFSNRLYH